MHNFKKLTVWEKTRDFVKDIYELSFCFPNEEKYGLTSQIRRAVVSISLNIAEGSGRTNKEFAHFLRIAYSSALEVETLLLLTFDLQFISQKQLKVETEKVDQIQKMIFSLI